MRRVARVCAALTFLSWPLQAQGISVLAGGVVARYADSISGSAGHLAVRAEGTTPSSAGALELSFSQFTSGGWVSQGSVQGSALLPLGRTASIGVVAAGFANAFQGGAWIGGGTGGPLLTVVAPRLVVALSLSGGYVRLIDAAAFPLGSAAARARVKIQEDLLLETELAGTATDSLRYVDAIGELRLRRGSLVFAVSGGVRAGDLADVPWGQARIEVPIGARVTLEAAAGRYPQDLLGFTDGVFANAGLRLHLTPRATRRPRPSVNVERLDEERVRLTFALQAGEGRPSIVGDWNDWIPLPLERHGRHWLIDLSLPRGVHKYAIVIDGTWTVPAGAPSVPDEFGGRLALLVIR